MSSYTPPKPPAIVHYVKPFSDLQTVYQAFQSGSENGGVGSSGHLPEAHDFGGYFVASGTPQSNGTSLTSVGGASYVNYYNPPYFVPMSKPALQEEVNLQMEAVNLSEQAELREK